MKHFSDWLGRSPVPISDTLQIFRPTHSASKKYREMRTLLGENMDWGRRRDAWYVLNNIQISVLYDNEKSTGKYAAVKM